jgi:hypothetical protein
MKLPNEFQYFGTSSPTCYLPSHPDCLPLQRLSHVRTMLRGVMPGSRAQPLVQPLPLAVRTRGNCHLLYCAHSSRCHATCDPLVDHARDIWPQPASVAKPALPGIVLVVRHQHLKISPVWQRNSNLSDLRQSTESGKYMCSSDSHEGIISLNTSAHTSHWQLTLKKHVGRTRC